MRRLGSKDQASLTLEDAVAALTAEATAPDVLRREAEKAARASA